MDFETLKLVAVLLLTAPYVPMLFMGEEYGESAPFAFFTSHSDGRVIDAVRRGRRQGFAAFSWQGEPPDPQNESTFRQAKLRLEQAHHGRGRAIHDWHRQVLRLMRRHPVLRRPDRKTIEVHLVEESELLAVRRWNAEGQALLVFHFGTRESRVAVPFGRGRWGKVLDSSEEAWQGPGSRLQGEIDSDGEVELHLGPRSVVVYSS